MPERTVQPHRAGERMSRRGRLARRALIGVAAVSIAAGVVAGAWWLLESFAYGMSDTGGVQPPSRWLARAAVALVVLGVIVLVSALLARTRRALAGAAVVVVLAAAVLGAGLLAAWDAHGEQRPDREEQARALATARSVFEPPGGATIEIACPVWAWGWSFSDSDADAGDSTYCTLIAVVPSRAAATDELVEWALDRASGLEFGPYDGAESWSLQPPIVLAYASGDGTLVTLRLRCTDPTVDRLLNDGDKFGDAGLDLDSCRLVDGDPVAPSSLLRGGS